MTYTSQSSFPVSSHRTYTLASCLESNTNLPPEIEEGNVEYKLRIRPMTEQRKNQLTSQLQWRLTEHGECFYILGVDDCGTIQGIHIRELEESLQTLQEMCASLEATVVSVEKRRVSRRPELYAAEVCIKAGSSALPPSGSVRRQVKIAFVGDTDAGKSTLVAILTTGQLDNGQGSGRISLLRHRHEVLSGRTSSLALEFLPFDPETREPIRSFEGSETCLEPIPLSKQRQLLGTPRVAQLIDLPGDSKYQKVTLGGLTSWAAPDWICFVVSATSTIDKVGTQIKDWLGLIIGLELPFFVVITKIDLVDFSVADKLGSLIADLVVELRKEYFGQATPPYAVSIMKVSSVSGHGINNLQNSISRLHQRHNLRLLNHLLDEERLGGCSSLYCVEGVRIVPDVGLVLSGTVVHGMMEIYNTQQHSPSTTRNLFFLQSPTGWEPIVVLSAHRMRLPVSSATAGHMVSLAVEGVDEAKVHRGLVLVAYRGGEVPDPLPSLLEASSTVSADVIGCSQEVATAIKEPIYGTLYYLGGKFPARLQSLHVFYLETKMRASFELLDGQTVTTLPGTRCIFVASGIVPGVENTFRIQGIVTIT